MPQRRKLEPGRARNNAPCPSRERYPFDPSGQSQWVLRDDRFYEVSGGTHIFEASAEQLEIARRHAAMVLHHGVDAFHGAELRDMAAQCCNYGTYLMICLHDSERALPYFEFGVAAGFGSSAVNEAAALEKIAESGGDRSHLRDRWVRAKVVASESGFQECAVDLATFYYLGDYGPFSTQIDLKVALQYALFALKEAVAKADILVSDILDELGEAALAMRVLQGAKARGSIAAVTNLANKTAPNNPARAERLYRFAVEHGDSYALNNFDKFLRENGEFKKLHQLHKDLLDRPADSMRLPAGKLCDGLDVNLHAFAHFQLWLAGRPTVPTLWQQDEMRWAGGGVMLFSQHLLIAAELGHPIACSFMAYMCLKGEGIQQDFDKCVYWKKQSAELGLVDDALDLATWYDEGLVGLAPDTTCAQQWRARAAQNSINGRSPHRSCCYIVVSDDGNIAKEIPIHVAMESDDGVLLSQKQLAEFNVVNSQMPFMLCDGCGQSFAKAALRRCARCRQQLYCGKDCQAHAWRGGHKHSCQPP